MNARSKTLATVAVLGALLVAGCSWQSKAQATLTSTFQATKAISAIVEPAFDARCSAIAHDCKSKADKICKPLVACQGDFKKINNSITAVHSLIAVAQTALLVDAKDKAMLLVMQCLSALRRVYDLANILGVISWKL